MTEEEILGPPDIFTDEEWSELLPRAPLLPQLEHSLATTFVKLQRERVPERRQQLWNQCLEFAAQLEKLTNE